jgi:hypothetical protein
MMLVLIHPAAVQGRKTILISGFAGKFSSDTGSGYKTTERGSGNSSKRPA